MPATEQNLIIRKLESTFRLSDEERAALEALPMQVQAIRADQDIVREGDRPTRCFALLEGFTATYKMTGDGKRQIHSWHVPGDIPDLQSLHLRVLDFSIGTLTPCRVGFIQHEPLRELCRRQPRIMEAFWRETLDRRGHLPGVDHQRRTARRLQPHGPHPLRVGPAAAGRRPRRGPHLRPADDPD